MSTPLLGAGLAPCGVCFTGVGVPATVSSSSGTPASARAISVSGDYPIDAFGHVQSMDGTAQRVQLALTETLGSSSIDTLGLSLTLDTWGSDTPSKVQDAVQLALAALLAEAAITLDSVVTTKSAQNRISIVVTWTDTTSGETNTTSIGGA